ncbi:putative TetR family transcriptional regulator [Gordonia effusa NBRC 100432]|uniref:Putative TetR family transcriptional regulator n=1 Tax=Gordonia effusa NBRC 100432 TaxID=1077974 RepID=H0R239_9ACTN|nr:TetR/AcrR family transcriptional regulator [Gordonia effusa]GAB19144.1 putative TetR family transcriptional regulator [Gordonia effusa NBRC 100432]
MEIPVLADTTAQREPITARGERTRANLIAAARRVFERKGYVDTKLSDITTSARCSTGTFYTYFTDKAEILQAVLEKIQDDMLHPQVPTHGDGSLRGQIEMANRAYLDGYRRNAKMMKLLDQVAAIDSEFRGVRRARSNAFVERNARAIAALQADGLADPDLDPDLSAKALSAMVSRVAFHTFCFEEEVDFDAMVQTCTDLWVNALRLPR